MCRWYQDPGAAVELTPAECRTHELGPQEFKLPTKTIRSAFASNPLGSTSHDTTPPPRTQTLPARDVFHNVQSGIRPLIAGIQTQEQVTELIQSLETLQYQEQMMNPPVISHKGRPRTARLKNAREGRQRGGGVTRIACNNLEVASEPVSNPSPPKKSRVGKSYKCSLCRKEGHNCSNCPLQS
ncbi:hypothetical protein DFH08DRAFT_720777 [Mycena albidolilacea]|uniref:Uncharacterized protein n=1 Tax=Mycena albidolilacea TaxID=1033008 RepID=A0AAD6Z3X1_9AGAR|nr:hypothetical protein DFH08DRAFT_720777 [Mycena albidolilacea]